MSIFIFVIVEKFLKFRILCLNRYANLHKLNAVVIGYVPSKYPELNRRTFRN